MKKRLSLFAPHLSIGITEYETDGRKEIALPGSIATNNNVRLRGEWFDDGLLFVAVVVSEELQKHLHDRYLLKP